MMRSLSLPLHAALSKDVEGFGGRGDTRSTLEAEIL